MKLLKRTWGTEATRVRYQLIATFNYILIIKKFAWDTMGPIPTESNVNYKLFHTFTYENVWALRYVHLYRCVCVTVWNCHIKRECEREVITARKDRDVIAQRSIACSCLNTITLSPMDYELFLIFCKRCDSVYRCESICRCDIDWNTF